MAKRMYVIEVPTTMVRNIFTNDEYCHIACDGLDDNGDEAQCEIFDFVALIYDDSKGFKCCQKCIQYTNKLDRENDNANN